MDIEQLDRFFQGIGTTKVHTWAERWGYK